MQSQRTEASLSSVQVRSRLEAQLGDAVRIVEVLGSSGVEHVLRAHDRERDDELFIRVFAADPAAAPEAYRKFAQRAESAALLDHPSLARVGSLQHVEGLAYYIIPGAGASTLESLLANQQLLPFDRSMAILRDVASALDYAHDRGVVHARLEPSAIGIRENGAAVVTGIGAGSDLPISHSGRLSAYMAPEQWEQHVPTDGRVDIYALGVIAFEMIAERRRSISLSAQGIAIVDALPITQDVPLRPGVGLHVNQALLRAVSKRAPARFARAGELVSMLEGRSHTPVQGLPTQRPMLDVEHASHFAFVPILFVAALGIALGVTAAPMARQALRPTGDFSAITDGVNLRLGGSPASAYASPPRSGSPNTSSANSSSGSSSSGSQSIFPGAATAAGGGTSGPSTSAPSSSAASSAAPARSSNSGATSASGTSSGAPTSASQAGAPASPTSNDSTGFVRVEVDGASGLVLVDGVPRGRSPFVGRLDAGAHSVSVVSTTGVRAPNRRIVVRPGDTTIASFSVAPTTPR
jgi:serine/threonine protein kinase